MRGGYLGFVATHPLVHRRHHVGVEGAVGRLGHPARLHVSGQPRHLLPGADVEERDDRADRSPVGVDEHRSAQDPRDGDRRDVARPAARPDDRRADRFEDRIDDLLRIHLDPAGTQMIEAVLGVPLAQTRAVVPEDPDLRALRAHVDAAEGDHSSHPDRSDPAKPAKHRQTTQPWRWPPLNVFGRTDSPSRTRASPCSTTST